MDYIMIDGVAVLVVSYVMTLSKPEAVLPNQRPTSSLLGPTCLMSVCGQQIINVTLTLALPLAWRSPVPYSVLCHSSSSSLALWA